MILEFTPNEFTVHELLDYMRKVYRLQLNGAPFKYQNVASWIKLKKVPDAYGGHKILHLERTPSFNNHPVLTLDGITRDILEDVKLYIDKEPIYPPLPKPRRARKQRTPFYYQILEDHGKQYTKKTKAAATLPEDWKSLGIKQNQLSRRKSKR